MFTQVQWQQFQMMQDVCTACPLRNALQMLLTALCAHCNTLRLLMVLAEPFLLLILSYSYSLV
jgi:hypothetical protein